jgi:hypothetical protein
MRNKLWLKIKIKIKLVVGLCTVVLITLYWTNMILLIQWNIKSIKQINK